MAAPTRRFVRKSLAPAAERFQFRVASFDSTNLRMVIKRQLFPVVKATPRSRKRLMSADGEVVQLTPRQKRAKTDGTQGLGTARTSRRCTVSSVRPSSKPWVPSLGLTNRELHLLETGDWLEDEHIEAAQALLRRQFPEVSGMQAPCLGLVGQLERFPVLGNGLQIITNGSCHWVAISCVDGHVSLYDNRDIGLTPTLREQIACLCPDLTALSWAHLQSQRGSSDCGLFAIANCVEGASGRDPADCFFDQGQMRAHLAACLKGERLTQFPQRDVVCKRGGNREVKLT